MNDSQIHAGHRERMINRFLSYPESLNDHEILEILLYNIVPRIDTNPLAHRLIRVFGSLAAVLSATEKELITVEGVGRKVASGLLVIGKVFNRVKEEKTKPAVEKWTNNYTIEMGLRKIITDFNTETFVMVLLNAKHEKIFHLEFEDKSKDSVTMDVPEVYSAFSIYKPSFAMVAHSHPSKVARPSPQDDFTTYKLNLLCEIHNVKLADHIILTETEKYSYFANDRMERVRNISDLEKILNQIEENQK
ncbi:MAG: RadC family protein [Clostridia bacterium]|nr:RadC family protein [Clostridia bacterium]